MAAGMIQKSFPFQFALLVAYWMQQFHNQFFQVSVCPHWVCYENSCYECRRAKSKATSLESCDPVGITIFVCASLPVLPKRELENIEGIHSSNPLLKQNTYRVPITSRATETRVR